MSWGASSFMVRRNKLTVPSANMQSKLMVRGCAKSAWICMILRASLQSVAGACLCISFHASFCWPPSNCQTRCQRESILTGSMALWKETFANFCAEGLPMLIFHPHATLPHCHIFHPSHSPPSNQVFVGGWPAIPGDRESKGLQITFCKSRLPWGESKNDWFAPNKHHQVPQSPARSTLPGDWNLKDCFFCLATTFFRLCFSITTFQRTTWLGVVPSMMIK